MNNETWTISKTIDGVSYGHRIFHQELDAEYCESGNNTCKCVHLHGHNASIRVFLQGNSLNDQDMVTDFHHIGHVKDFLDKFVDHKFVLSTSDPWFVNIINAKPVFQNGKLTTLSATQPLNTKEGREIPLNPIYYPGTDHFTGYEVDATGMSGPEFQFFNGFFLVDFVPTSERLSAWLFHCIDAKMSKINVKTVRVDWWETSKSKSTYSI